MNYLVIKFFRKLLDGSLHQTLSVMTFVTDDRLSSNSSSFSLFLPHRISEYLLANSYAVDSPIPEVAPVISAIFFIVYHLTKIYDIISLQQQHLMKDLKQGPNYKPNLKFYFFWVLTDKQF